MPMAFASLLGGLMTQIGTSPEHRRVAGARRDDRRQPSPCSTSRRSALVADRGRLRLPHSVLLAAAAAHARGRRACTRRSTSRTTWSRRRSTQGSAIVGKTVATSSRSRAATRSITSILRAGNAAHHAACPTPCCKVGDILLIEGDHEALDRLVGAGQAQRHRRPQGRRRRRRRERSRSRRWSARIPA